MLLLSKIGLWVNISEAGGKPTERNRNLVQKMDRLYNEDYFHFEGLKKGLKKIL